MSHPYSAHKLISAGITAFQISRKHPKAAFLKQKKGEIFPTKLDWAELKEMNIQSYVSDSFKRA